MTTPNHETVLKGAGLRVTPGRLALLSVLERETKPASVEQILKSLKGSLNQVTLYRALESFVHVGIVVRVDLGHDHAHYELIPGRPHHHHVVCRSCGYIEDIEVPHASAPAKDAEKRAQNFSSIDHYSLEFFGTCATCA